jgi:hypothetical protein
MRRGAGSAQRDAYDAAVLGTSTADGLDVAETTPTIAATMKHKTKVVETTSTTLIGAPPSR